MTKKKKDEFILSPNIPEDPFENLVLSDYEQAIEDSITEDFEPVHATPAERRHWQKVALRTLEAQKSKRINIRIKRGDLALVKARAEAAGMPYQTLLSTLIKKYADGEIRLQL